VAEAYRPRVDDNQIKEDQVRYEFDISKRPAQWQADVGEIVSAYRDGGQALANRSYRAIVQARKLVQWTALALAEDVRQIIKSNDEFNKAVAGPRRVT
jgi:hypothetical protein